MPSRLGRIQRAADFERLLKTTSRARSPLFALHHMASEPSQPAKPLKLSQPELSTGDAPLAHKLVDDHPATPSGHWLGLVVPKRLAKRAVTRNLVRRLARASLEAQLSSGQPLPAGLWALRLRAPIDKKQFPSAKSDALRAVLRDDLELLWQRALNPRPPGPRTSKP
jgi:ribonuclease P protein component